MSSKEEVARRFWEQYGDKFLSHDVIAFGSGTTVRKVIEQAPVEDLRGLKIVSTSRDTTYYLEGRGITPLHFRPDKIGAIVDGADSIQYNTFFIKGGGGALLREKIAWRLSDEVYVVVTPEKFDRYYPIPIVTLPFLVNAVIERLEHYNLEASIRKGNKLPPTYSDDGLVILDVDRKRHELSLGGVFKALEEIKADGLIIEHGLFPRENEIIV